MNKPAWGTLWVIVVFFLIGSDVAQGETPRNNLVVDARVSSRRNANVASGSSVTSPHSQATVRVQDPNREIGRLSSGIEPLVRRSAIAVVLSLSLAVALLVAASRRKISIGPQNGGRQLEVISTVSIGPRCCLTLVRVQDQTILVSRDSSGVKNMIVVPNHFASYLEGSDPGAALALETTTQPR